MHGEGKQAFGAKKSNEKINAKLELERNYSLLSEKPLFLLVFYERPTWCYTPIRSLIQVYSGRLLIPNSFSRPVDMRQLMPPSLSPPPAGRVLQNFSSSAERSRDQEKGAGRHTEAVWQT